MPPSDDIPRWARPWAAPWVDLAPSGQRHRQALVRRLVPSRAGRSLPVRFAFAASVAVLVLLWSAAV
jgi:hypothetical protein